jgi:hypothetical protein
MMRYTIWVLPTLFVGTVFSISQALRFAGAATRVMTLCERRRSGRQVRHHAHRPVAGHRSGPRQHLIQHYEEALNKAGRYCIDNLINRLLNE